MKFSNFDKWCDETGYDRILWYVNAPILTEEDVFKIVEENANTGLTYKDWWGLGVYVPKPAIFEDMHLDPSIGYKSTQGYRKARVWAWKAKIVGERAFE